MPYTVCIWEPRQGAKGIGAWFDEYSFDTRAEAYEEAELAHGDKPRTWVKVLRTDGTAADLIAKRTALAAPRGQQKEA